MNERNMYQMRKTDEMDRSYMVTLSTLRSAAGMAGGGDIMREPWQDWDDYCRDEEQKAANLERPTCEYCDDEITDDHHYNIDGCIVCKHCVMDFLDANYREATTPTEIDY